MASNNMASRPEVNNEQKDDQKQVQHNPSELNGVADLSQLIYLDMPNVLHNLKHRYKNMPRKHCYTSLSSILLAINPYETLPIYGQDVINEFHAAAQKGRLPSGRPHPYGVSARANMRMIQRKCNQSIIVCGESGAGKTETTKLLMRYLAMTAPISADKELTISIEEQIVAASPILEAFGNAKTVMNNNSSRFGKFTKLLYHVPDRRSKGTILGSSLETYLLEKSRVVSQALNERNFHIFYFLHSGLGAHNAEYGLRSADQFHYTNQGKCFTPMKDIERFQELTESLSLFRIDADVQALLWKITSGVLNIGNINFRRTGDGFTDIDKASMETLGVVARLWGLSPDALEKRLTTSTLKMGRGAEIIKKVQFDSAEANRDSIAKSVYQNIFLWLCKRINAELLVDDGNDAEREMDEAKTDEENGKYFIGILDVFGFENFWSNSLEQFCINYTNEKLQAYFNHHIIASEQEEYINEGVYWKPLHIPNNRAFFDFVEAKAKGFFTLIDSNCLAPKVDTNAFMQELFRAHKGSDVLKRKKQPGSGMWRGVKPKSAGRRNSRRGLGTKFDGFEITHYADKVCYDSSKFLIKNAESVHSDTAKMIKRSKIPMFREINGVDGKRVRSKSKKKKSVTSVFFSGIKKLMRSLNATEPYFVRCINPNKEKSSTVWTESIVQHQLRCGGLMEALRVLTLGYPTRVPYRELYDKYHASTDNPLLRNMGAETFSTSLLIAFDVNADDYELGLTKIFFKPAKAAVLETIMSKAGQPLTAAQNAKITKYLVAKRARQMIGVAKTFCAFSRMVRRTRAEKLWKFAGRVAAIEGATVVKTLALARQRIRERKRNAASFVFQNYFRAMQQRKEFIARAQSVKESAAVILSAYTVMKQRAGLAQYIDEKVQQRRVREERERIENANVPIVAAPITRTVAVEKPAEPVVSKEDQLAQARAKRAAEAKRVQEEKEAEAEAVRAIEAATVAGETSAASPVVPVEVEVVDVVTVASETETKTPDTADEISDRIVANQNGREMADRKVKKKTKKNKHRRKQSLMRKKYKPMPGTTFEDSDHSDSDADSEYLSDGADPDAESMEEQLRRFPVTCKQGQLFFRHAGSRRRTKPQDRVIKVSFDHNGAPSEISWGRGSRNIKFADILYIAAGFWTPTFQQPQRNQHLKESACLSVVSSSVCLNLEAHTEQTARLWVRGLRQLKQHSDEFSDRSARDNFKNLMTSKEAPRPSSRTKKDVDNIVRLQQDLFVMSVHTVMRHLEEERIWALTAEVRQTFTPQIMYPTVLKADIPWRQWQAWIRDQVTAYCRENNLINAYNDNHHHTKQVIPMPAINPAPEVVNNNNNNNGNNSHEDKCSLM